MKRLALIFAAFAFVANASAQIKIGKGQLAGSFESNSIYYVEDSKLDNEGVDLDDFGTHNYLKLDYTLGKFSAGVQADAYLPVLRGYDITTGNEFVLSSKYIRWQDKQFEVLLGDVYDQVGNGLIFRSFEDRQLGLNNGLEGARGIVRLGDFVQVKAMFGRPRLYTKYADATVAVGDVSLSLSELLGMDESLLSVEGSYVNRNQSLTKDEYMDFSEIGLTDRNLGLYSGRVNFAHKWLSLRAEYAAKGKDMPLPTSIEATKGSALLGEVGINHGSFSMMGTFRRLERMGTRISLYDQGTGNTLNYLPALTRQYTYMLANLEPYQVNTEGEVGGQVDMNYSLRSKENRYRYWNFHLNFSSFYTLEDWQSATGDRELLWCDINFDVERQWNRKLKTAFLFSRQEWNPEYGFAEKTYVSNIFVADVTYKFNRKKSLRAEVQYLLSNDYEGDWVAGLVEFSLAPHWSFFLSDMYNLGETDMNYYNGGLSYTHSRTRAQLSFGRNRAGYICSGGVCRFSPAYTGVNLMLTTSF